MKEKELDFYMSVAKSAAEMSYAVRKRVGACVITQNRGIYIGYNGTLKGQDNCCEEKVYMDADAGGWLDADSILEMWPHKDEKGRYKLVTKSDVTHGEMNALSKMLKEGVSAQGSTLVVTLSPCASCSVMIASSGVKRVVYLEEYRDAAGIEILKNFGLEVTKYETP